MKPYAKKFYNSKEWYRCRNTYAKKVNHLCERCLSFGIYSVGEIVHHIKPITPENINDPNITLNFDNLEMLCRKCHMKRHENYFKRYGFDEEGNLINYEN